MANVDRPCGFKTHGYVYPQRRYIAASTIYPGDAVKLETGAANTTQFNARVEAGSDTGALLGVAMNYAVAGDSILVADHPDQEFVGQCDESDFNENADLGDNANILSTAGDSTFKASRMEIDSSDIATTATHQIKILGVVKRQDGKNAFGANVQLRFIINNHQLKGGTGTQTV
jgi:hypothetical protein